MIIPKITGGTLKTRWLKANSSDYWRTGIKNNNISITGANSPLWLIVPILEQISKRHRVRTDIKSMEKQKFPR